MDVGPIIEAVYQPAHRKELDKVSAGAHRRHIHRWHRCRISLAGCNRLDFRLVARTDLIITNQRSLVMAGRGKHDSPFVDASHTSILALTRGFCVLASRTRPCMYTTSASFGVSNEIVAPFSRTGWSCLKNGPRMALCVATVVASDAFLYVISSTRLVSRQRQTKRRGIGIALRFQTYNITNQLALVSFLVAHLTCPVDQSNTFGPFIHR